MGYNTNSDFRKSEISANRYFMLNRVIVNNRALLNSELSSILDINQYLLYTPEERLEKLLRLFDAANPTWKNVFNREQENKPREMRIVLSEKDKTEVLEKIISIATNTDPKNISMLHALNIYVANKVAHTCTNAKKNLIGDLDVVKNILEPIKNSHEKEKKFNEIINKFTEFFRDYSDYENAKTDEEKNKITKRLKKSPQRKYLIELGVSPEELKKLWINGFGSLVKNGDAAFSIKDIEIREFVRTQEDFIKSIEGGAFEAFVDRLKLIDFGMGKDRIGKDVLVINLPYFGQFSVHLTKRQEDIKKSLIDLKLNNYKSSEIFEKESVMIVPNLPQFNMNSDEANRLAQRDPRYALFKVLKEGGRKKFVRETLDRFQSKSSEGR